MHICTNKSVCVTNEQDSRENSVSVTRKIPASRNRARSFSKFRPSKFRRRYIVSNKNKKNDINGFYHHHRLDHTYAAGVHEMHIIVIDDEDDDDDDENAKSNNNREQDRNSETTTRQRIRRDDEDNGLERAFNGENGKVDRVKEDDEDSGDKSGLRFNFSELNGALKQYQRNRKNDKVKSETTSALLLAGNGRADSEEKRRWIAALALIELAESK